jgi:putative ABC transport system substrate-binding protein
MQFGQLKRREFISLFGSAAAWPLVARAQQPNQIARIGYLSQESAAFDRSHGDSAAFRDAQRDFGYVEGRNLHIEFPQTISVRQEPNSPKLAPNPVFVELRAKHLKKKPPAVAARANSSVASAAPATSPAASAVAPAPSPAPDAAPSAVNNRWPDLPSVK